LRIRELYVSSERNIGKVTRIAAPDGGEQCGICSGVNFPETVMRQALREVADEGSVARFIAVVDLLGNSDRVFFFRCLQAHLECLVRARAVPIVRVLAGRARSGASGHE